MLLAATLLVVALAASAHAVEARNTPQVMGWVPAYGVDKAMTALDADPLIGHALTRIGLQFWNPTPDGRSVVLAPADKQGAALPESAIARVRDWARARGIRVLLTVYNNSETTQKWNWELARHAFRDERQAFIAALVAQMQKYDLDGVDIDLEGEGDFDADRAAFARFVRELSSAVHAQGKLLTVNSFHSPCYNAPNMSWWADWRGHADAIQSMGYADLYEASEETFTPKDRSVCAKGAHLFKYSWQLAWGLQAGYRVDHVVLGLPTWVDRWGKAGQETDAASHIREAQALGAGIALWDLQLEAPGWRSFDTWSAAYRLRTRPGDGWKSLSKSVASPRQK